MDVIELNRNPGSVLPTVNPGRAYSFALLDGTRPPTIQKDSYPIFVELLPLTSTQTSVSLIRIPTSVPTDEVGVSGEFRTGAIFNHKRNNAPWHCAGFAVDLLTPLCVQRIIATEQPSVGGT